MRGEVGAVDHVFLKNGQVCYHVIGDVPAKGICGSGILDLIAVLLELEVIEGNERAIALYKKFGFETVAEKPDAIRLKDGTSLKEITMMKKL